MRAWTSGEIPGDENRISIGSQRVARVSPEACSLLELEGETAQVPRIEKG